MAASAARAERRSRSQEIQERQSRSNETQGWHPPPELERQSRSQEVWRAVGPLEHIRDIAARVARTRGLEVLDLEMVRQHGRQVLRIVLDRPWPGPSGSADESVTLEDCARVSEEVSTILDVEDPVPDRYTLEVSSPGLDRPLRHRDDYRRFEGRLAKIVLSEPIDRQTAFAGRLRGIEGDEVLFESEGGKSVRLPFRLINRARLDVEF